MSDTREQIIEQMARAVGTYQGHSFAEHGDRGIATAAMPIAIRAATSRVRDALAEVQFDLSYDDRTKVVAVDDILPTLAQIDAEWGQR